MSKYNANIIYLTPNWIKLLDECQSEIAPGKYGPARAIGFQSLRHRVRATWLVWTGRADALIWPGGQ